MDTLRELKKKIAELRRENAALRERLATVARLEPNAPASAEYRVARLIGGSLTSGQAAHDIVCARGKKFEVKFSRIGHATAYVRRWSWGQPLGISGAKRFHRLILVGEIDPQLKRSYLDPKSPYVIFDVPFSSVARVMRKSPLIQLTTNPDVVSSESGKLLFEKFQVTRKELSDRYKVPNDAPQRTTPRVRPLFRIQPRTFSMISIFHGTDEASHNAFQQWRKEHVDGFHMTEGAARRFTIHWTQDMRENLDRRGCNHQGVSSIRHPEDEDGCYTAKRKVCSDSLSELRAWAASNGFSTRPCSHCDTSKFPFPA